MIQEQDTPFCFGGTLTLNDYDLNLHLEVLSKWSENRQSKMKDQNCSMNSLQNV